MFGCPRTTRMMFCCPRITRMMFCCHRITRMMFCCPRTTRIMFCCPRTIRIMFCCPRTNKIMFRCPGTTMTMFGCPRTIRMICCPRTTRKMFCCPISNRNMFCCPTRKMFCCPITTRKMLCCPITTRMIPDAVNVLRQSLVSYREWVTTAIFVDPDWNKRKNQGRWNSTDIGVIAIPTPLSDWTWYRRGRGLWLVSQVERVYPEYDGRSLISCYPGITLASEWDINSKYGLARDAESHFRRCLLTF